MPGTTDPIDVNEQTRATVGNPGTIASWPEELRTIKFNSIPLIQLMNQTINIRVFATSLSHGVHPVLL